MGPGEHISSQKRHAHRWSGPCVDERQGGLATHRRGKNNDMKYGIAWLLGVPPILIAGWFLLNHC
jgi:hypothetical protein